MKNIRQSMNYKMFHVGVLNRPVENTAKLKASMKKYGWITAYPMHVTPNGGDTFEIKAGHHRFQVAKELGLPVKYVVENNDSTIPELESTKRPWRVIDYLRSYAESGIPSYKKILYWHNLSGIGVTVLIALSAGGVTAGAGASVMNKFRNGSFTIGDEGHVKIVLDIIEVFKMYGFHYAHNRTAVTAIAQIVGVTYIDERITVNRFKESISKNFDILTKQPTADLYLEMFEEMYNRRTKKSNRVNLAWLAKQESDRRNIMKKKEEN